MNHYTPSGRYCQLIFSILQQQKKQRGTNTALDHSRAASCFGSDGLLQTLTDLANKKDGETMLKVGVVGKTCHLYGPQ